MLVQECREGQRQEFGVLAPPPLGDLDLKGPLFDA